MLLSSLQASLAESDKVAFHPRTCEDRDAVEEGDIWMGVLNCLEVLMFVMCSVVFDIEISPTTHTNPYSP